MNKSNNPLISIIESDSELIRSKVDLSELEGKHLLVTGASGLLGTYFLASLHSFFPNGNKVSISAVIQSPLPQHLQYFVDELDVTVLKGDLTDFAFCQSLPHADFIIHAAGYGQPGRFMENPIKTLKLNTWATFQLLDKLNPHGKFLFISTSEVYSGLPHPPYNEEQIGTTNTTHPRSCYIEAKRGGEAICNAARNQGTNAKSARLALAYGPGTKPGDKRVLNNFIEKAIQGNITLMDQGQAFRTYCYVTDAVEMLWNILFKGTEPIYNVGGHSRVTIAQLAQTIGTIANVPVSFPDKTEDMAGAPDDVYLDMAKTEKEFHKKTYITLEDGLTRTFQWQKSLYLLSK